MADQWEVRAFAKGEPLKTFRVSGKSFTLALFGKEVDPAWFDRNLPLEGDDDAPR